MATRNMQDAWQKIIFFAKTKYSMASRKKIPFHEILQCLQVKNYLFFKDLWNQNMFVLLYFDFVCTLNRFKFSLFVFDNFYLFASSLSKISRIFSRPKTVFIVDKAQSFRKTGTRVARPLPPSLPNKIHENQLWKSKMKSAQQQNRFFSPMEQGPESPINPHGGLSGGGWNRALLKFLSKILRLSVTPL